MTVVLIVAGGRGERLGADRPKALVELAGRPLLSWSIDALAQLPDVEQMVVALPAGVRAPAGVTPADGGATRSESVARALAAAGGGDRADAILVHDAARPLVTAQLAQRVLARLDEDAGADGAIAAAPVTDTVKRTDDAGVVRETLDRGGLWAVQTPQVFRRGALERALDVSAQVLAQATDDAWLIERAGGKVLVVAASAENLKVTTALDLALAEVLLARRGARADAASG